MKRKIDLVEGEVYHVFIRSIAGFVVFNNHNDYERIINLLKYYRFNNGIKFSDFCAQKSVERNGFDASLEGLTNGCPNLVQVIGYCIMPTHIHLILKEVSKNGISDYMRKVLNSYSSFFNITHKRRGPLWESKFQNVLVKTDEQLIHLTRYIHLNTVSASIVENPMDWPYSSYKEYINVKINHPLCQFDDLLDINPKQYQKFVLDHKDYQRELSKIKHLLIDENL